MWLFPCHEESDDLKVVTSMKRNSIKKRLLLISLYDAKQG